VVLGGRLVRLSGLRLSGRLVVLHAVVETLLELLLGLPEVLGQLRQLRAAEHQEHDDEDDDELARSQASHTGSLTLRRRRCRAAADPDVRQAPRMLRATWARWRRMRRRSRSESPPQMPNFSPFCRANSRHCSWTMQPRHTSLASRVDAPRSGKK